MPTYVVTGAARGIGYEWIRQLSQLPNSTVFGLVRSNAAATTAKIEQDGLKNIHILEADITDRPALIAAANQIATLVPSVDYLINNAGIVNPRTAFSSLVDSDLEPEVLEEEFLNAFTVNVVGVVKTVNAFLPLIRKSEIKKVVALGTGLADDKLTNDFGLWESPAYSASKAALNTVFAKYNAKLGSKAKGGEGITFVVISPGVVDTGSTATPPPDFAMPAKLARAFPDTFRGPITPVESVTMMRQVIDRAGPDNEFAGGFVSHYGNKQWV